MTSKHSFSFSALVKAIFPVIKIIKVLCSFRIFEIRTGEISRVNPEMLSCPKIEKSAQFEFSKKSFL
jgi:hypothetical protein